MLKKVKDDLVRKAMNSWFSETLCELKQDLNLSFHTCFIFLFVKIRIAFANPLG